MVEPTTEEIIQRLNWHRMHRAAGIVEDAIERMGGQMTEWQGDPGILGKFMSTEVGIKGKVLPVFVFSSGGIHIKGMPLHPFTCQPINSGPQVVSAIAFYTTRHP